MSNEREIGGEEHSRLLEQILAARSAFISEILTPRRAPRLGYNLVSAIQRYYQAEVDRDPGVPLHDVAQRLGEIVARSAEGDFTGLKEFLRKEAKNLTFVYPLSGAPRDEAIRLAQRLRQAGDVIPDNGVPLWRAAS